MKCLKLLLLAAAFSVGPGEPPADVYYMPPNLPAGPGGPATPPPALPRYRFNTLLDQTTGTFLPEYK